MTEQHLSPSVPNAEQLYADLRAAVAAALTPQTVLLGIYSGGAWLAQRLAADLQLQGRVGFISSSMYRDDFAKRGLAASLPTEQEEPLAITLTADGKIMLQTSEVAEAELIPKLQAIAAQRTSDKVFLRADGALPYERVAQVMGALNAGGFSNIGLVTDVGGPTLGGTPAADAATSPGSPSPACAASPASRDSVGPCGSAPSRTLTSARSRR